MTKSPRPPAPFLPPEIVTQIIENITRADNSYHLIARINSSWTIDAQNRLFDNLDLVSMKQLRLLVPIIESQTHLAQLVNSAFVDTVEDFRIEHGPTAISRGIAEGADLIFRFFSSATNLKALRFEGTSYTFSDEQQAIFFSKPLLPSLRVLYLMPCTTLSNYSTFECILASSPALESLHINPFELTGQEFHVFEPNWSARIYPRNLKNLSLDQWEPFAEGKIWPIESMVGLERFTMDALSFGDLAEPVDVGLFFKTVGPTLKSLDLRGTIIGRLLNSVWSDLVVLEQLYGIGLEGQPNFFLNLPATIKDLTAIGSHEDLTEALKVYEEDPRPKQHYFGLFHLAIACSEELEEGSFIFDLKNIPRTKILSIYAGDYSFQSSLDALEMGEAKFGEIILCIEDFDKEEVKKQCKELGIKLRSSNLHA